VNLTQGLGRKNHLYFRYVHPEMDQNDPDAKWIDSSQPLLLRAEDKETHDTGFYRVGIDGREAPQKLLMQAKSFSAPVKAKNADVFLLTASTFEEFPDLLVTDSSFRKLTKVSDANPQKSGFLWGTAELIHYRNIDGVPLAGILYKPENFDPKKKYPLLVYIYEKLSQNLHSFIDPRPNHSIVPTYYVSNGYLVLEPDIVYNIGQPGQSALKCVMAAIDAVSEKGFVDEKAIGIQGHSWGGYQIAYMVTQTSRFRAAAAGAPVSDMISAYDGIRWGPGRPRQFQYEHEQSRIGGSLWQAPLRYIENSPIFGADRVTTPLLLLHNDADDAVPWYQGIEYFLALRRLGKEAYLFSYNGEPHGLRRRADQKDYTVRLQQFFDHFLKGAPAPEWMEKGIPYLERDAEKERLKSAAGVY
jgi:dipeptidyl aminopeptidase/acylaminoacyl peptidase